MPKARFWDGSQWVVLDAQKAETALNALKLGGNDPSYYATSSSVSTLSQNFTDHKTDELGHNLASASKNGFMAKGDFTKLGGISTGANKTESSSTNGNIKIDGSETVVYTHPANHAATIITTDSNNRFVTDAQIASWSGKQTALGFTPENIANKGVASGYASLDTNGLVPLSQLPSRVKESIVVNDIAAKNAITGSNLFQGLQVFVIDATGDATVAAGGAEYIYNGSAWVKIAESESMDIVLQWNNIQGKPSSLAADIDDAVTKRHSHTNKTILDSISAAFTTGYETKLNGIADGATKTEIASQNGYVKVNGTEIKVYQHPASHTSSEISDFSSAVKAIKVDNAVSADTVGGIKMFIQSATPALGAGDKAFWINTGEAAL